MIYENIPNIITISGMGIVNYSLYMYNTNLDGIYLYLMLIGFTFDFFDGYIARRLNTTSSLGNILDKITDKVNHLALLNVVMYRYDKSYYYLYLYILREIIIFILRINNLKAATSTYHAKVKTVLFPLCLLFYHYHIIGKDIYFNLWFIYNFLTIII